MFYDRVIWAFLVYSSNIFVGIVYNMTFSAHIPGDKGSALSFMM